MHAARGAMRSWSVRDAPGSTVLRVLAEKSVPTSEICVCLWISRISAAREAKGRSYSELSLAAISRACSRAPKPCPWGGANVWYMQVRKTLVVSFADEQGLATVLLSC